jgi:hypothetical protein
MEDEKRFGHKFYIEKHTLTLKSPGIIKIVSRGIDNHGIA